MVDIVENRSGASLWVCRVGVAILAVSPVCLRAQDLPTIQPTTRPAEAKIFSEDFESGELVKSIWDVRISGSATVSVQQEKVAHGKNALVIKYPATGGRDFAFISTRNFDRGLKKHLFGRAYVFVDGAALPGNHCVFALAGGTGFPISNFLEIGAYQQKFQLSYQANAAGIPRGQTVVKGSDFPVGKWVCMEWEFNDDPDQMAVWIDGKQTDKTLLSYKKADKDLVKGFDELTIGFRCWGRSPSPVTVYYDDIAIGSERLGEIK